MQQLESTTIDKQKTLTEEVVEKQLELSTLRGRVAECEKRLEDRERECHEQKLLIDDLKEDYSNSKSQVSVCGATKNILKSDIQWQYLLLNYTVSFDL